ncbi:MAG: hypothetical protein WD002_07335 [Pseudomonadales bacterium]
MERLSPLLTLLLFLIAGCGSSDDEFGTPVAVNRIVDMEIVSPANFSVWFDDQPITFTASVLENGVALNLAVVWESDIDGRLSLTNNIAMLSTGVHTIKASIREDGVIRNERSLIAVVEQSELIEALILGTGELATSTFENPSCPRDQEWGTWRSGSNILIRVSDLFETSQVEIAREFANVVNEISSNNLFVSVEEAGTTVDEYVVGEINVVLIPEDSDDCNGAGGCADHQFDSDKSIVAAVVKVRAGSDAGVMGHELGHALLGLCHIDAIKIAGDTSILASPRRAYGGESALLPTELDVLAFQSVFLSSASPGATRQDLVDIGVLKE